MRKEELLKICRHRRLVVKARQSKSEIIDHLMKFDEKQPSTKMQFIIQPPKLEPQNTENLSEDLPTQNSKKPKISITIEPEQQNQNHIAKTNKPHKTSDSQKSDVFNNQNQNPPNNIKITPKHPYISTKYQLTVTKFITKPKPNPNKSQNQNPIAANKTAGPTNKTQEIKTKTTTQTPHKTPLNTTTNIRALTTTKTPTRKL